MSFKDAIEVKKNICLAFVDGKLSLKKSHYYYYQIQGQLAIANRDFCDLVVYADKDMHIERVPRVPGNLGRCNATETKAVLLGMPSARNRKSSCAQRLGGSRPTTHYQRIS
jgi:hypothetical protein